MRNNFKAIITSRGIIHRLAVCKNCGWSCDDYRTAISETKKHVNKTGHSVIVESAHSITYGRVEK